MGKSFKEATDDYLAGSWTTTPPDRPGHWWHRAADGTASRLWVLHEIDGGLAPLRGLDPVTEWGGEWWSEPVPQPPRDARSS